MTASDIKNIGVVGAGSWGTTLGNLLAEKGFHVDLWVYEPELAKIIATRHENTWYLPGHTLSANISPTNSIEEAIKGKAILVMAVPSHVYRDVAKQMIEHIDKGAIVVSVTKGIENETLLTMSGIWREVLPSINNVRLATLSGPSFALEVISKLPTAVTIASRSLETARWIRDIFYSPYFRAYSSGDVIGVELAGAIKNVIAIAAGISDGLGYGHNTRAALITRGLNEIAHLGTQMGSDPLTFSGLSGMGDLVLTCTGDLSRNRTIGLRLGRGESLTEIMCMMKMVAEGIKTTKSVYQMARREGVEMPLCNQVYQILYQGKSPTKAVEDLMMRQPKDEM